MSGINEVIDVQNRIKKIREIGRGSWKLF